MPKTPRQKSVEIVFLDHEFQVTLHFNEIHTTIPPNPKTMTEALRYAGIAMQLLDIEWGKINKNGVF